MIDKKKPDFLIVGAAKSGTTSLYRHLNKSNKVFIPYVKECKFFSSLANDYNGLGAEKFSMPIVKNYQEYMDLFSGQESLLCGDASPDYLYYYKRSIPNILNKVGKEVKVVIILRNPVDRAYSNYMHHIRERWEDVSFSKALDLEESRISNHWSWGYHYFNAGLYSEAVKAFKDNFPNLKIYLFEDLKNERHLLESLSIFLGIEYQSDSGRIKKYNSSGIPKNELWHKIIMDQSFIKDIIKRVLPEKMRQKMKKKVVSLNLRKSKMGHIERINLINRYKKDIRNLEQIIGRDLSEWTKI